jgi:hypothetical protein
MTRCALPIFFATISCGCGGKPAPQTSASAHKLSATTRPAASRPVRPVLPADLAAKLDRKVPEWKSTDLPLAVALAQLQAQTGLRLEIRWDQMPAGAAQTPINLHLYNIKVTKVFRYVLDAASGPAQAERLCWWVEGDAETARVAISSEPDYVRTNLVTFEFEIADILAAIEKPDPERDVITLIKEVVAPDSWLDGDRGFATIRRLGTRLIVQQTKQNQCDIDSLLDQLREQLGTERRIDIAVGLGQIQRHVLSFTDTRFQQDEAATYLLDGVALGKGDKGFANLLASLETWPAGSILVDATQYESGALMTPPAPYQGKRVPYARHREMLIDVLTKKQLRFECPAGTRLLPPLNQDHLPPLSR